MKPKIFRTAVYELNKEQFNKLILLTIERYRNYHLNDLCDGGEYIEFKVKEVTFNELPYIGSIEGIEADIVQIWHKFERKW